MPLAWAVPIQHRPLAAFSLHFHPQRYMGATWEKEHCGEKKAKLRQAMKQENRKQNDAVQSLRGNVSTEGEKRDLPPTTA